VRPRIPPFASAYGAALLAALAGSSLVVRVAEHRIDEQIVANVRLQTATDNAWAAAAGRAATDSALERLRRALAPTLAARDATARSAAFVRDAARIAALHRTHVAAIVPAARIVRLTVPSNAAAAPPETAYEITLEGRYADLLATLRALAQLRPPANVDLTGLTRKNPNAPDATVIAALRVSLTRFRTAEPADASAALR
jgi:hypothetical protein